MSSLSANPKAPHKAQKYNPNLQRALAAAQTAIANGAPAGQQQEEAVDEPPADWMALLSLVFGVAGLMMRYKICAWLAVFTCFASVANMRRKDMDFKQLLASVTFSVMGLIMNYATVRQPGQIGGPV